MSNAGGFPGGNARGWNWLLSHVRISTFWWSKILLFHQQSCINNNFSTLPCSTTLTGLMASCNEKCGCADTMQYRPVCGTDSLTYFSPCHAGCRSGAVNNNVSFVIYASFCWNKGCKASWNSPYCHRIKKTDENAVILRPFLVKKSVEWISKKYFVSISLNIGWNIYQELKAGAQLK